MVDVLARLKDVQTTGKGWSARCPAHEDGRSSLSIHHRDGKWLLKCHAGCSWKAIIGAIGFSSSDLFGEEGESSSFKNGETAQPSGVTLNQYAAAKALPVASLRDFGLSDMVLAGRPAVRIPYRGPDGAEMAVRFRVALAGDRFRWKSGNTPCLYGLNRLSEARTAGQLVLVEGESDVHTLWHHGIPALGLPGASSWREERDAKWLDGIDTIYIVVEPDKGGDAVRNWLSRSSIRTRAKLLARLPAKDPSELHLADPDGFQHTWKTALQGALSWTESEAEQRSGQRTEAWKSCAELAGSKDILAEFDTALGTVGLVGERRIAKLIYLVVTSRLLDRPISIALKGPSSGGKSFTLESVLKFFPNDAFYALTAMSDRALAYSIEPLKHRHLVIYEAAGMASDFATYLIRSLLSEGRLRYETVEKSRDGLQPRLIEREGPTGLIVTTTSVRLHPENETRMLTLTVSDTREQTAAVFRALAAGGHRSVDLSRWQALQIWLGGSMLSVAIPYANHLAEMIPPVAIRLRRDFRMILTFIRAHALLHQESRLRNADGEIVAEIADYAAAHELLADLVAEGAEVTIKPEIRETVDAVAKLLQRGKEEVRQSEIRTILQLDKSVVSRRVSAALEAGVLRNLEDRKGRPARLVLGDPLPPAIELLPKPERLHGCTLETGDRDSPPAPTVAEERCEGCGNEAWAADPLLIVSTDNANFFMHRSCLDDRGAFQKTAVVQP